MRLAQYIKLSVGILIIGAAPPAVAAEYCVACVSPDANYRCQVGSPEGPADPRAWLLCITELAKQGGHESCSVARNAPAPCPGVQKVLAAPEGESPAVPVIEAGLPEPAVKAPPQADAPASGEPPVKKVPQTVQEMASDTIDASKAGMKKAGETVADTAQKAGEAVTGTAKTAGQQIGKAGSTIGSVAKKSWDCVVSLFQIC